ncbi:acyltransferase family protein [Paenibacillus sp. NPDC058177]|uniref:acyltransferase family protein n=1 Tax=Paenibacillus sp. NPDC058177 TaxID=3346369 RepID=UPI0036DAC0F3
MKRNEGLDILRSTAILLVLICHGISAFYIRRFESGETIHGIMEVSGILGVELFFVLSGFLIGKIIIRDIIGTPKWASLKVFYIRRWYRTLPIYYMVLLGMFIIRGRDFYWGNLLFIQNYSAEHLSAFPVSWSLSIEEWFYLILPVIFLICTKIMGSRKKAMFFGVCFSIIMIELSARIIYTYLVDPQFDFNIRKQIHFRMDSIVFGVLLAGIKHYYNEIYMKVFASKYFAGCSLLLFLINSYVMFIYSKSGAIDHSFYARTLFFTVCPITIMFILSYLESNTRVNQNSKGIIAKVVFIFSITSYSVYLLHPYVFMVINKISDILSLPSTLLIIIALWIVSLVACLILGTLMYRFVEKPILNYRDKITLVNKNESIEKVLPKVV